MNNITSVFDLKDVSGSEELNFCEEFDNLAEALSDSLCGVDTLPTFIALDKMSAQEIASYFPKTGMDLNGDVQRDLIKEYVDSQVKSFRSQFNSNIGDNNYLGIIEPSEIFNDNNYSTWEQIRRSH